MFIGLEILEPVPNIEPQSDNGIHIFHQLATSQTANVGEWTVIFLKLNLPRMQLCFKCFYLVEEVMDQTVSTL